MTKTYLLQFEGVDIPEADTNANEAFNIALAIALKIELANLKNTGILDFDEAKVESIGDVSGVISAVATGDMEAVLHEAFKLRLEAHNGVQYRAAKSLGIDQRTLMKYVEKGA